MLKHTMLSKIRSKTDLAAITAQHAPRNKGATIGKVCERCSGSLYDTEKGFCINCELTYRKKGKLNHNVKSMTLIYGYLLSGVEPSVMLKHLNIGKDTLTEMEKSISKIYYQKP